MSASSSRWLVAAGVVAAALFALLTTTGSDPPIGRGSTAPDFELELLGGMESVSLESLRGHVVLLNFWATWCKPCEDEMPAMERLHRALAPQGFALLAISVDETREEVEQFRERLDLSFPILLDPEKRAARAYQTFRFPESLLIGPDGVVIERYIGPKDWDSEAYLARIRRLL